MDKHGFTGFDQAFDHAKLCEWGPDMGGYITSLFLARDVVFVCVYWSRYSGESFDRITPQGKE